jgi:CubicO group peptidase (beta-lactamase class C family)
MPAHQFTRRTMITNLLWATASTAIGMPSLSVLAESQSANWGRPRGGGGWGRDMELFREQFRVPAMSVAISKRGEFVYDRTCGMADAEHSIQARQNSLFRIGSLSKSITAVTIFSLIEKGKLNLTDKIFGPSGVLEAKYGKASYKPYVTEITVDHLLTHTAGGWADGANDPMLHNNLWGLAKLISSTVENAPLSNQPGTKWAYSNFGYCLLGRVIEQVTGQSYESYIQADILAPCGISGMQIARNHKREHATNEVIYIGQYSEDPYKINLSRMDSSDGWIASSTQLVQFLNHVAGAPGIPALLKSQTVRAMTTPAPAYPEGDARYARGWMVSDNGAGDWWHDGSLPGSTSLMVRASDGSCWAALCNTRTQPQQEMDSALSSAMLQTVQIISDRPTRNGV